MRFIQASSHLTILVGAEQLCKPYARGGQLILNSYTQLSV
jgi:hypothetical protein